MLFNPKWDKAPTLRRFVAWLKTKPAGREYDYYDVEQCACAQFFNVGAAWARPHINTVMSEGVSLDVLAAILPHTFGALLDRAQAKLEELESVA